MYALEEDREPGDKATFFLKTPYLLLYAPVQPQEVKSNAVYFTELAYMSDCIIRMCLYMSHFCACTSISKLSLQLSVVAFSFSHVHSSPHISNDSFITTFTSKLTACKFPHSICDRVRKNRLYVRKNNF